MLNKALELTYLNISDTIENNFWACNFTVYMYLECFPEEAKWLCEDKLNCIPLNHFCNGDEQSDCFDDSDITECKCLFIIYYISRIL